MRAELVDAFGEVLDSGRYMLGEQVAAFEREWAASAGAHHAVGVSSGTDALALALRAAGVNAGDEVLVPAMTALATWMAVAQIGATPVGVDIETDTSGIDAAQARAAITDRTRAIVPVHLFGDPADLDGITAMAGETGLAVVEDAAQAHGARLHGRPIGTFGVAAAWSFYPTKNLGAIGDAGAVTTDDPELAARVGRLREYGCHVRWDATEAGINARLDEVQAALLRVALVRLDAAVGRRRAVAARYRAALGDVDGLELLRPRADAEPACHLFVVRHHQRDRLAAALDRDGIGTLVHYTPAPALAQVFRDERHQPGRFPHAERHAAQALSLPLHPTLTDADVDRVIDAVRRSAAAL